MINIQTISNVSCARVLHALHALKYTSEAEWALLPAATAMPAPRRSCCSLLPPAHAINAHISPIHPPCGVYQRLQDIWGRDLNIHPLLSLHTSIMVTTQHTGAVRKIAARLARKNL